jgi:hypothetical protein
VAPLVPLEPFTELSTTNSTGSNLEAGSRRTHAHLKKFTGTGRRPEARRGDRTQAPSRKSPNSANTKGSVRTAGCKSARLRHGDLTPSTSWELVAKIQSGWDSGIPWMPRRATTTHLYMSRVQEGGEGWSGWLMGRDRKCRNYHVMIRGREQVMVMVRTLCCQERCARATRVSTTS